MQLAFRGDLAFVTAELTFRGTSVIVPHVLIDTGAASTVLNADIAADANVFLEPTDHLRSLRGVGGRELVFVRQVDRLAVGNRALDAFEVEIGEMDYGIDIGGVLGMDFLLATGAMIDLRERTIEFMERSAATSRPPAGTGRSA